MTQDNVVNNNNKDNTPWQVEFPSDDKVTRHLKPSLVAACAGNERIADVLDQIIYMASWEAKNKGMPASEKIVRIRRTHQEILEKLQYPTSRRSLISYLHQINEWGYVLSQPYQRDFDVHFEKIQQAINNPPIQTEKSSKRLQEKGCNYATLQPLEKENTCENCATLHKKVADLHTNCATLHKKVADLAQLQRRFEALERLVQDHFFGSTDITDILPSITDKDNVANATPSPISENPISEPQTDIDDFAMGIALQEFLNNRLNPVETHTGDTLEVRYTLPTTDANSFDLLSLYEDFSEPVVGRSSSRTQTIDIKHKFIALDDPIHPTQMIVSLTPKAGIYYAPMEDERRSEIAYRIAKELQAKHGKLAIRYVHEPEQQTVIVESTTEQQMAAFYEDFSEEEITDASTRPINSDSIPPWHTSNNGRDNDRDNAHPHSVLEDHREVELIPTESKNSEQHNIQPELPTTPTQSPTDGLQVEKPMSASVNSQDARNELQRDLDTLTQTVDELREQAKETSNAAHHINASGIRTDHPGSTSVRAMADTIQDAPNALSTGLARIDSSDSGNTDAVEDKQASDVSRIANETTEKPDTQEKLIERPSHPQMPHADTKWCAEKMVQITEVLRYCDGKQGAYFLAQARGAKGKSQRQRQLDAAKKIFAQNVTEEQYVRAYTDRNDEWWNDTKGSLTVEAMAANNKDSVMRILAILEKLESRGSIKRARNNVTPMRPTNTPQAKQEPSPEKTASIKVAEEMMARLKQQKQAI